MRRLPIAALLLALAGALGCGRQQAPPPTPQTPTPRSYVQNLLGGLQGAAVERTRGDMNAIATALNAYSAQAGEYPPAADLDGLAALIAPTFIRTVPQHDAWGQKFRYRKQGEGFVLVAPGPDTQPGSDDDTVLTDHGFTQLPKGYEPNFAR